MNSPVANRTLKAAQESALLSVAGYGGAAFQVQGTFVGTLTFEATIQGEEWVPFSVTEPDNTTRVTTTTAGGVFVGSTVGFTAVRARMSAYTSGGASVIIRADVASPGSGGGGGGAGTDVNLAEVGGASIALGQAAMAASLPVVIASNQTAIPITGSITADNNAAGPVGDPIPADASSTAYEGPSGNLETFKLESFDYDTTGSSQPQTTIGLVTPSATGPLPVSSTNPLPVTGGTIDWTAAGATGGTVLTTELNALANGAYSAYGSEVNNSTGLHRFGWLDVSLASLNPTTGANLVLLMIPAYDGTNYPDAPSATNPGLQWVVQTVYVATGSATKRTGTATFSLPPFKVKFVLVNNTNVALAAASNTVTLYTSDVGF